MAVINKDYSNIKVGTTDLQRLYAGNTLIWELESPQPTPTGYSTQYLTFISRFGDSFKFTGSTTANTISYSTDSGTTWSTPSSSVTVNVGSNSTVMWKGNMVPDSNNNNGIGQFGSDYSYNVEGNIMSLIYGDNFLNNFNLNDNYTFSKLFSYSSVVNAENLVLPATTLTSHCYYKMFANCMVLAKVPSLQATTLASGCYREMFYMCANLPQAPQLLATTLVSTCYLRMFYGCSNLTQAPSVLPATTLEMSCYEGMFQGCLYLTTMPIISATTVGTESCHNMFNGCTSLVNVTELKIMQMSGIRCLESMFASCTSLTTAPVLSATTLTQGCYRHMFSGCTNLNYIKMLATDITATDCLYEWVNGVSASGTFVKDANTTIPSGNNGIPTGWTVQNE